MLIDWIWKWFILNEQISWLMDNDVENPGFCPSTARSFPLIGSSTMKGSHAAFYQSFRSPQKFLNEHDLQDFSPKCLQSQ